MDKAQLRMLPDTFITYVADNQVDLLSINQIKLLQPGQIPALKWQNNIQAIDKEQMPYLTDKQIPQLKTAQLCHLEDNELKMISPPQIETLDDPATIQRLSDGQVKHLKGPQIAHVLPAQVPSIGIAQIKHLKTKEQINQVPTDKFVYLDKEQVALLEDDKLQYLTGNSLVQAIDLDKLNFTRPTQIKWMNEAQLRMLPETFIPHVPDDQVDLLNTDKINSLSDEKLQLLKKIEHIQALPARKIWYVNPAYRHHMGCSAYVRVAIYGAAMAVASCFAAVLTIAAFTTGIFFLRNTFTFCNKIWNWITHPFYEVAYLIRWIQGHEPITIQY